MEKTEERDDLPEIPQKGTVREYWETICVVLIFVLFARTWIFQNSNIPSGSMKDTLLVGDRLIVNSFVTGPVVHEWERKLLPLTEVDRGDIVVFKFPGNPQVPFIKRVIAKEGDVVQVLNNQLFVNGKMQLEGYALLPRSIKTRYVKPPNLPPLGEIPYLPDYLMEPEKFTTSHSMPGRVDINLKNRGSGGRFSRANFGPYRIPEGHFFVLGDNRMNSEDSRYWGALDEKLVLGKAWIIWWSFEEGDFDYMKSGPVEVVKRIGDKIIHFFSKTRWNRFFHRPS